MWTRLTVNRKKQQLRLKFVWNFSFFKLLFSFPLILLSALMESLRGIFPQSMPPPKRDFLKENVMKIKQIQRMTRRPKDKSEYSNKFAKPGGNAMPVRSRLCENANPAHRSSTNLALSSSKAPITNLRKSLSTLSIHSREFGTQTVDPEADEFFLKDTIIRYPSASTVRSSTGLQQPPTCSRGHAMEPPEEKSSRYKSHFNDRRDEYSEKMERHISNLSEYLDKGSVSKRQGSKKPTSILKSSSSLQKLNKNSINESQQREDRSFRVGSAHRNLKLDTIELSDDENQFEEENLENNKEMESSHRKERGGGDSEVDAKKLQQQKAAAEDPDCPDGHVPLSDDERLEALKLAKKRK